MSLERELSSVEGGRRWLKRGAPVAVVALLLGAAVAYRRGTAPPPPARYVAEDATTGDVVETVQSTGVIKPVTEVKVGAQVSGRVSRVFVDFNSVVKKGELLAEIDPLLIGAQVEQNRAQRLAQRAGLARAEANVATIKVSVERLRRLRAESLATQAELDQAQGQLDAAVADVAQARAQIAMVDAQVSASQANLSFTKIFAPIDGVVTDRQIDPGQTVAASFQAPVLFVIAEDLRKMRVFADIDEADVGKLAEGMAAEAQVDAFFGQRFQGRVSQIRYAPNSVQGVVTYTAIIEVENPDRKLRPGMTATVTVRTKEAKAAPRVPNAALRFKPTPEKDKDGRPVPRPPEPPLEPGTGRVHVLVDPARGHERIEARVVKIGVTDGVFTALAEPLPPGLKVVVDETDDKAGKKGGPRIF
ncbi:MAG: efflux RND transporter periplasmic adaptor subunit [Polyangiaceae bacterium]|nr:efflux RND transporter periplasmic adaptor subunit [Polyangiaceae bacterium]